MRFRHARRAASTDQEDITLDSPVANDILSYGKLRWLDGANTGLAADIIANSASVVTLARSPHFLVASGATIELIEGCDKRLETCATRFGNAINFRGEPHLPGNDLLTRYPGAG